MISYSVAKRYAKSLFDLASEQNALKSVSSDLDKLSELLSTSEDFATFVANPLVRSEQRIAVFTEIFGARSKSLTYTFVKFLESKKRSNLLLEVCQAFNELTNESQGVLQVEVTSAAELSQAQFDSLAKKLADKHGKEVHLTASVNADLIGGFRLRIGDSITDHTVSHKLNQFRQRVLSA